MTTSDRKGIIFIDSKPVAEGSYVADVAIGPHTIAVTRDGYERYEKRVSLADKDTLAETVTMKLPEAKSTGAAVVERSFDGLYGGFGLLALFEPGGEGNEIDTGCAGLDASKCATAAPLGGGSMGWFGYAWHPVGIELFLAGEYDQSTPSATFVGSSAPLENPLAVGQPRVEQFAFLRVGGIAALRARVSVQTTRLRGSLAAGFGVAYKEMLFERDTKTNSGAENVFTDKSGHSYIAPAISVDGSIAFRVNPTTAIALGVMLWFETAGSSLQSNADGAQYLGAVGSSAPPSRCRRRRIIWRPARRRSSGRTWVSSSACERAERLDWLGSASVTQPRPFHRALLRGARSVAFNRTLPSRR